nr:FtsX-like permease family protein [Planosporangium flavigriseum]
MWTGWRAAVRVARREAWRSKGRSTLVIAMIGLPVAALGFAAVTLNMFQLTPMERLERTAGAADALVYRAWDGPIRQKPDSLAYASEENPTGPPGAAPADPADAMRALLPPGSRLIPDVDFSVQAHTVNGIGPIAARALDLTDPLTRGVATVHRGRSPHGPGEVALTEQAVTRTGAELGDTVRLLDEQRYRVVGIVEFPNRLGEVVLFDPAHRPAGKAVPKIDENGQRWLVDTPRPLRWSDVRQLNKHGVVALSRDVIRHPPAPEEVPPLGQPGGSGSVQQMSLTALVVGVAVLEIVLLAGPAFAVGARRRQRDLALLAANGATPAHLRRVVLADGVVLGAAGAVAGIALGIMVALVSRGPFEDYITHSRAGGYRIFPLALAGIAAFAVVTATLAATVPAFVAARQDVVAALAGRRGVTRSRKRWLVLGAALTTLGVVVGGFGAWRTTPNLILAGLVTGEIGLVLCTPALVGLVARMARVLPLAPRIALRDTARNRAAAAPAISAVMAAVAGSVALGVYQHGVDLKSAQQYQPSLPHGYATVTFEDHRPGAAAPPVDPVTAVLRDTLPTREVVPTVGSTCAQDACLLAVQVPPDRRCPFVGGGRHGPTTPAEQRAARRDPRCGTRASLTSGFVGPSLPVDDGTGLAALTGASGEQLNQAIETLRTGGVVVFDPVFIVNDHVTIEVRTPQPGDEDWLEKPAQASVSARAYVMHDVARASQAVLSPALARQAGLHERVTGLVAATTRMPTKAERDRLTAELSRFDEQYPMYVEDPQRSDTEILMVVLMVAAAVISLGAAGIATGLAAADSRPDLATLAAVGASPRVRRVLSLSQSGVIAGLGSLLGTAAGLGAAAGVLAALNRAYADLWPAPVPYPITVPWLNLAVALLVVPGVAMLGAGLLTRSRLPVERRL